MITLIRSSLKLLFRNKAFWFFLIVVPALSSLIFLSWGGNMGSHSYELVREIREQKSIDERVAYYSQDGAFVVKVYDAASTKSSEFMLEELAESGLFLVARSKTPDITKAEVDAQVKEDCENDRMGAAIYLSPDFDRLISEGKSSEAMTLYVMSEDARYEIFESQVKTLVARIREAQKQAGVEKADEFLSASKALRPSKEISILSGKNSRKLTEEQQDQRATIGYAFAIMTLGYVFGGIFIAHTIIKEEQDKVLTRVRLTGLRPAYYFLAKFVVSIISTFAMTVSLGIFTLYCDPSRFGMNRFVFLGIMFLLGLIFSSFSLVLGILMGSAVSANIGAFTLWSMSSLLAGMYFPLDETSKMIKAISSLMPQKWFLEAAEMIFIGDKGVYLLLACVVVAYMVIMLSVGSVGIKLRNGEE